MILFFNKAMVQSGAPNLSQFGYGALNTLFERNYCIYLLNEVMDIAR